MAKKNISDTKEVLFTAKDLYGCLIKNVFNTYTLCDRWEDKPEEIGRTYFYDKKNAINPFDRLCCERIHTLYAAAFNDKMSNISSSRVSQLLCKYLPEYFDDDFDFLVFYSGEDEKTRQKKINGLLRLLDKMTDYASEHDDFRLLDTYTLADDIYELKSSLGVSDKTENKEQEEYLRKQTLRRAFTYDSGKLSSTLNMINEINGSSRKKGKLIYFLNSSISEVWEFLQEYLKYSKIEIEPIPTINYIDKEPAPKKPGASYVTRAYWRYVISSDRFIPEFESGLYTSAYDLEAIEKELAENNKTYYILGNSKNYERLIKHMKIDKLILLIPKDINRIFKQLSVKGYTSMQMAQIRLNEFKENIDYCLNLLYPGHAKADYFSLICTDDLSTDTDYIYYSGLMDALIANDNMLDTMKTEFLNEYASVLKGIADSIYDE